MFRLLMMNQTELYFLNVGNGDSVLLRNGSFIMLVDGGSNEAAEYADSATGRIPAVDFLEREGVDHIDLMVCTHIHEDHVCGLLPVAKKWPPHELWTPYPAACAESMPELIAPEAASESVKKFSAAWNDYRRLCRAAVLAGCSVRMLRSGMKEVLAGGTIPVELCGPQREDIERLDERICRLRAEALDGKCSDEEAIAVLDRDMNRTSLILLLRIGTHTVLLPGDMDFLGYGDWDYPAIDIFKAGHHGQKNSVDEALLRRLRPRYAVISASSDRRYDSAHASTLRLLSDSGAKIFFTDCPDTPPWTDGLTPHRGILFRVPARGDIQVRYLI